VPDYGSAEVTLGESLDPSTDGLAVPWWSSAGELRSAILMQCRYAISLGKGCQERGTTPTTPGCYATRQ